MIVLLENPNPLTYSSSQFGIILDYLQQNKLGEIQHLLESGFSSQEQDSNTGNNFLHISALQNAPQAAKLFLGFGTSANHLNNSGLAPIHLAVIDGNLAVLQVLLKSPSQNLDIKTQDSGLTPLMLAAWYNRKEAVEELLAHRAREDMMSQDKLRAYDYALWQDNQALLELLDASMKTKNLKSFAKADSSYRMKETHSGIPIVMPNQEKTLADLETATDNDFVIPEASNQQDTSPTQTARIMPETGNFDTSEADFQQQTQEALTTNSAITKESLQSMQPQLETDLAKNAANPSEQIPLREQQDIKMHEFPDVNLQDIPDPDTHKRPEDSEVEFIQAEKHKSQELLQHFDKFEFNTFEDAEISLEEIIPDIDTETNLDDNKPQASDNLKVQKQKNLVAALAGQKPDERSTEEKLASLRMLQKPAEPLRAQEPPQEALPQEATPKDAIPQEEFHQEAFPPHAIPLEDKIDEAEEAAFVESGMGIFAKPSDTQAFYNTPSLPRTNQETQQVETHQNHEQTQPSYLSNQQSLAEEAIEEILNPWANHNYDYAAETIKNPVIDIPKSELQAPPTSLNSLKQATSSHSLKQQIPKPQESFQGSTLEKNTHTPERPAFPASKRQFTPLPADDVRLDTTPKSFAGREEKNPLDILEDDSVSLPDANIMQSRGIANIIESPDEPAQASLKNQQNHEQPTNHQQKPVQKEVPEMKHEKNIYRSAHNDEVHYDSFSETNLLSGQQIIDEIHSLVDNPPDFLPPSADFPFRTLRNGYVQSSLEMNIVNILSLLGLDFKYRRNLFGTVTPSVKQPKFTFFDRNRNTIIWEMLDYDPDDSANLEEWNNERMWYENNGFKLNYNFFVMYDDVHNSYIDSLEIYKLAQTILDQC